MSVGCGVCVCGVFVWCVWRVCVVCVCGVCVWCVCVGYGLVICKSVFEFYNITILIVTYPTPYRPHTTFLHTHLTHLTRLTHFTRLTHLTCLTRLNTPHTSHAAYSPCTLQILCTNP